MATAGAGYLLKAIFLACYSLALATTVHAVTITTVPSNLHIELPENETVLLQFHVHGEIPGGPRTTVSFVGEGQQQQSCTGRRNYAFHFESKPLVKNLSVVCDQAYWADLNEHRQKYEVRITNGHSARNVDRVTVLLEVELLQGNVLTGKFSRQFEIIMMKPSATPTPEMIATAATPTSEATTTGAPFTSESSTAATFTPEITTTDATPTPDIITTGAPPTLEIIGQDALPVAPETIAIRTNNKQSSTALADDVTMGPPTTETMPTTRVAPTTMTLPTLSAPDNFISAITSSTQNQVTLVVGAAAALLIVTQFVVIVCLVQSRRRYRAKLVATYSESSPV